MRSRSLRQLRKLLDGWSVSHFLFGVVVATAAIAFEWSLVVAFVTMLVVAVAWEYFERRINIKEAFGNPWMDIVLPIMAFGLTLLLVDQKPLLQEEHIGLFVCATGLFLFVNAAAWKARFEKEKDFIA